MVFREVPSRPEARSEARARLDGAMRRPRRGRQRFPALLAAAVVALSVVVVPMMVARWQPNAAAQALERIASLEGTVLPELDSGSVIYREYRELRRDERVDLASGNRYTIVLELQVEEWISSDLSRRRLDTVDSVSFASEDDRIAWVAAGRPSLPESGDVVESLLTPGELDYIAEELVPNNPSSLDEALGNGSLGVRSQDGPGVFLLIGDLLAQGNLGQDQRMALLDVASDLDGIELVGTVTDPTGRLGLALSVEDGPVETELIFDEASGDLLASVTRDARGEFWTAYLATDVVQVPPGDPTAG